MSLDAVVFCDCFEKGRVRTRPPQPELVYIDETTGQVLLRWDAPGADQHRFYDWLASACEHGPMGELVSHRLGNVALIAFLRELFSKTPGHFSILLSKVVYNGVHGGDRLDLQDVERLATEMASMHALHCLDANEEEVLRRFEAQMLDLIRAVRSVGRPIVF